MNWGRAKTILIILFLIIDIFLITLLSVLQNDIQFIKDKTIKETVNVLNSHNIEITYDKIPARRQQRKALLIQNLLHQPRLMAEQFLGQSFITVRENENESFYKEENLSLLVSSDGFILEKEREKEYVESFKEVEKVLFKDLKKFGYGAKDIVIERHYIEDGICHVVALHTFEENKIMSSEIEISADKNGILNMRGKCFSVYDFEKDGENLPDITSVLCSMIYEETYSGIEIKEIEVGYNIDSRYENSFDMTANPVYIITDSYGKEYVFDVF